MSLWVIAFHSINSNVAAAAASEKDSVDNITKYILCRLFFFTFSSSADDIPFHSEMAFVRRSFVRPFSISILRKERATITARRTIDQDRSVCRLNVFH